MPTPLLPDSLVAVLREQDASLLLASNLVGTEDVGDNTPPPAVAGLALTSQISRSSIGRDVAIVVATWDDIVWLDVLDDATDPDLADTFDPDDAPVEGYFVAWRIGSGTWNAEQYVTDSTASSPALPVGVAVECRVRARTTSGTLGPYASTTLGTTAVDTTAPPTPSAPAVVPILGGLRVVWNGQTSTSGAMPSDFQRVDVHLSTTSGFTPDATTLRGALLRAGEFVYGTDSYAAHYARLVAVDFTGNASSASLEGVGTPDHAVAEDIADNAITAGKIAAGAITADKIGTGTLGASVRITAGSVAPSASRVEIDAAGVRLIARDGSNVDTTNVNLDTATGLGTFTGTVQGSIVRAVGSGDVSVSSTGHGLQVGPSTGQNVGIDGNEIMARNNGGVGGLHLQADGGAVAVGFSGTSTTDLTVRGRSVSRGVVAYVEKTDDSGQVTTTETMVGGTTALGTNMRAGRLYRITCQGQLTGGAASDEHYVRMKRSPAGGTVTAASATQTFARMRIHTASQPWPFTLVALYAPASDNRWDFGVSLQRVSGSSWSAILASGGAYWLIIEDVGAA